MKYLQPYLPTIGSEGKQQHRTGWPPITTLIKACCTGRGINFCHSLESLFAPHTPTPVYGPLAGFAHVPPLERVSETIIASWGYLFNLADFSNVTETYVGYVRDDYQDVVAKLRFLCVLSVDLADYYQNTLDIPTHTLCLPGEQFTEFSGKPERVITNGNFLKNTAVLNHIDYTTLPKVLINTGEVALYHNMKMGRYEFYKQFYRKSRDFFPDVKIEDDRLPDEEYDDIMRTSVFVMEYHDLAASTQLVDCIMNNTPVVLNRLPAAEEYLGDDYPLFYDDYTEIPGLIDRWDEGWKHLRKMDKGRFSYRTFYQTLDEVFSRYD